MKKQILVLAILLYSVISANAQINKIFSTSDNLEHVYTYLTAGNIDTGFNVEKYFKYDIITGTQNVVITFYNLDFSIYKSINITMPEGMQFYGISFATTKLFNSDDLIEFVFTCTDYHIYKSIIMNENNEVIFDLGDAGYGFVFANTKGEFFLKTRTAQTSIYNYYSLSSSMTSGLNPTNLSQSESKPFPNPAKQIINLPYQLEQGKQAIMKIYDISGKQIVSKQINSAFNKILLDVTTYAKGMYVYEYNGISGKFIVK